MKALNLEEAAAFLHINAEELRARAKRGAIPGAKIGRRWVFLENDLAEFIRSNGQQASKTDQLPAANIDQGIRGFRGLDFSIRVMALAAARSAAAAADFSFSS
ncbi:MAG TPA: helix-turn-helix domain-containing protein [Steroidobacteraceae bacterium]|nr:helix-turn-helix domain-containing protein [Steroidobacteraceae bacterium]